MRKSPVVSQKKFLRTFAKSLLKGLEDTTSKAFQDRRSHAAYWNGDDWGSISGIRDAQKWVSDQREDYVVKRLRNFKK